MPSPLLLLTPEEMGRVDARSPALGVPSRTLMENAGRAVADAICARFTPRRTAVLCGPGNNGGDGYVVARLLAERGWDVWVERLGERGALKGDAADASRNWTGKAISLAATNPLADLYVDALFGAGLSRALEGEAARLASTLPRDRIVAVDVPSGLPGDGRAPAGACFAATLTVTFCRKKPAHVLEPGRSLCGAVVLADIGVPEQAVQEIGARAWENAPALWSSVWPRLTADSHKHSRGRLTVAAGGVSTSGAARLAARAGARIGAGYVTLACPPSAVLVNATHLTSILLTSFESADDLRAQAERADAFVVGPAFGLDRVREPVLAVAALKKPLVLDADAISGFADRPNALLDGLHSDCVLTPHGGEFKRLFPDLAEAALSKIEKARAASKRAGAVVLFKGGDTVIAAPDGRVAVNTNAPPILATAGSGDVLAGLIGGLLAQHMPPWEAACAASWVHGEAATLFGPGLIADDLPDLVPRVLESLSV